MIRNKEAQVEVLIDRRLENLKWKLDHRDPGYNVAKENVKSEEEKLALEGKVPDYVLYDGNDRPLGIIEAKRPHEDLEKALEQGIGYAKRLKACIVFATDGIFTKSYHVKYKKPLYLNKEEVDDFVPQAIAMAYVDGYEFFTEDERVIKSRGELIPVFKRLNNNFHEAGIPAGRPRIELFCNFLFLKLISELSEQEDSMIKPIPGWANWDAFTRKYHGEELFNFINRTAFDYFKRSYGGEVLSPIKVNAGKYAVLDKIVESLEGLVLHSIDSDIKGDAFEFFLRNYGGADTDFGEYFTPRHVVKALVKILNPQMGERVYDPFCGTGGMLTYSYKHVYNLMARTKRNVDRLKEETVYGGELTDMSRVAKMNMILAGDGHSNIFQQDSYATPQRGRYDVVITNMPFGSGMKTGYAKYYGYNTQKAEVVGVLHCLDALSGDENARAGILVPEGTLFNSSKAYTSLREQLMEQYSLENIISLPSGVFGKNTGVKSNVLIIKKHAEKQKNHIWYFKVENDGFTLDAHRRKIEGANDIDVISSEKDLGIEDRPRLEKLGFRLLYKDKIKENNYVLLPGHYEEFEFDSKYEMVPLGNLASFLPRSNRRASYGKEKGLYPFFTSSDIQKKYVDRPDYTEEALIIGTGGKSSLHIHDKFSVSADNFIIQAHPKKALNKYIYFVLKGRFELITHGLQGVALKHISKAHLNSILIPLPPLEVQKAVVEELESYQAIIQSAKKIMASWKPFFQIKDAWERVRVGEVCDVNPPKVKVDNMSSNISFLPMKDLQAYHVYTRAVKTKAVKEVQSGYTYMQNSDLVIAKITPCFENGKMSIVKGLKDGFGFGSTEYIVVRQKKDICIEWVYYCLRQLPFLEGGQSMMRGSVGQKRVNPSFVSNYTIPLPPLEEQRKIVAELEEERGLIEGEKKVIAIFGAKMKKRLNRLWQG